MGFRKLNYAELKILIVDDVPFLRSLVQSALKQLGCEKVLEAENGEDAIRKLEDENVNLIICDIDMEPMNGFQLVKAIRGGLTSAPFDVPIVMLTGHAEQDYVQSAMKLHINGFIIKPVSPDSLSKRVELAVLNPMMIEPLKLDEPDSVDESLPVVEASLPEKNIDEESGDQDLDDQGDRVYRTESDMEEIKKQAEDHLVVRKTGELSEGAILAQDIDDCDGNKLLRRGTVLSKGNLKLLIQNMGIKELLVLE